MTVLENRSEKIYMELSLFLIVYICISAVLKVSVLNIGLIFISFAFINRPEYLLPGVLISSLLGDFFVAFPGMGVSRILVLAYITFSFIQSIRQTRKYKGIHIQCLFWASVFCFFSSGLSLTGEIKPAITMILNLVMLFFMMYEQIDNYELLFENLKYCICIFSIFLFGLVITGRRVIYISGRLTLDGANSNVLGMCLAQLIIFLLATVWAEEQKKAKIIETACICINVYILLLTGSRSSAIATIVTFAVLAVFHILKKGNMSKKIISICMVVLGLLVAYKMLETLNPILLERFTAEDILADGGTGRAEIWEIMLKKVIPEHFWLGIGLGGGNTVYAMSPYIARALGVHNLYITVLAQIGFIGSLFFYIFWIKCVILAIKYVRQVRYLEVPFFMILAAFINGIGEEVFSERFLWYSAGLIFMFIYNYRQQKKIDYRDCGCIYE